MKSDTGKTVNWLRVAPMALGAFGATLDNNIINTCLPAIVKELDCGVAQGQFIASLYTFTICSLILFFAYVSIYAGRRRMFSLGVLLFSVSSFWAAVSATLNWILSARIMQGVGAAMFMSNGMALINSSFDNSHKGRAFGIQATAIAVASISGPALGAVVASRYGWQANFIILSIAVLPAAFLARVLLDEEQHESRDSFMKNFDFAGTVYSVAAVLILVVSFAFLRNRQWQYFLLLIMVDIFLWFSFLKRETAAAKPVLNVAAMNNAVFIKNNILAFIVYAIMMGVSVITPIYLVQRLGIRLDGVGVIMSFSAVATFLVTFISGTMADKKSPELVLLLGKLMITGALMILMLGFYRGSIPVISAANVLFGFGIGFFNPPNNKVIMLSVDKKHSATAASINVLVRNIGISVGIALSGIMYEMLENVSWRGSNIAAELCIMLFLLSAAAGLLLGFSSWRLASGENRYRDYRG